MLPNKLYKSDLTIFLERKNLLISTYIDLNKDIF